MYPLFYEALQHNTANELKRIFEFLDFSINETAIACAIKNQEGFYMRPKTPFTDGKGRVLTMKDIYTNAMIVNIAKAVSEVGHILKVRYGVDWNVTMPNT